MSSFARAAVATFALVAWFALPARAAGDDAGYGDAVRDLLAAAQPVVHAFEIRETQPDVRQRWDYESDFTFQPGERCDVDVSVHHTFTQTDTKLAEHDPLPSEAYTLDDAPPDGVSAAAAGVHVASKRLYDRYQRARRITFVSDVMLTYRLDKVDLAHLAVVEQDEMFRIPVATPFVFADRASAERARAAIVKAAGLCRRGS